MSVDRNPAEGRVVLLRARSTSFFPWYEEGGVISRVAGQRVYYKDEDGNEKFTHEYAAVVDTKDEADQLLEFSRQGRLRVNELRQELINWDEALVKDINDPQHLSSKAVRKTRSRSGK